MIEKLPPWVEIGGVALTMCAGAVNAVGLLGFSHQAVSHLTGSSTLLGLELARGDLASSAHLLLILASFVVGATMSGAIIRDATLKLGRRYGWALLLESLLLVLSMVALTRGSELGHYLASAACGLQNALASTYSGAVIRTTHVSGLFTDLGIMLGGRLRGLPFDRRRAWLYLLLIGGFVAGGSIGTLAWDRWSFAALLLPATVTFAMSVAYWILRWLRLDRRLDAA